MNISSITLQKTVMQYWDPQVEFNQVKFGSYPAMNENIRENIEVQYYVNNDEALLLLACSQGRYELAKGLIESGYDVNQKDIAGFTPIMRASTNGHKNVVELLLSYGAKITLQLLSLIKNKIDRLEQEAKKGKEDPYSVTCWKNFLDFLIKEGKN
jgi:ankyrin repeat protein